MNHARAQAKAKAQAAEPFDADALLAEIAADAKPFVFKGETFMLPAPTAWPDDALEAANSDDLVRCAELILGEDEYARFRKLGGNALFLQRLVAQIHGATMGESSASSAS